MLLGSAVPTMVGVSSLVGADGGVIAGAAGGTLSIRPLTWLDSGLVLPAASFCSAVKLWGPSESGELGVKVQSPLASTTADPMGLLPSNTVTVAPGSPFPLRIGVLSPLGLGSGSITGATGAEESITIVEGSDSTDRLPVASVASAVKRLLPSFSAMVVKIHWPEPSAVAVPSFTPLSYTVTRLLGSAVPVRVRVVALVTRSLGLAPLSGPTAVITGLAGAWVSITRLMGLEAGPVLP